MSLVLVIMNYQIMPIKPFICAIILLYSTLAYSEEKNGFVLDQGLIPPQQVFKGGPAKDGIPAIDKPEFIIAADADFLQADDRILGIEINGVAKAYPISILNWHEIVNDSIDESAYTLTYCPLCGTGVAFNRIVNGQALSFGVSGLLYNNDVLLYDRDSESLWSQILGKAVSGKYRGTKLSTLSLSHTTWSYWKRHHSASLVLSRNTGYTRNYDKDPYTGYKNSRSLYFPVLNKAPADYHPKETVLGLTAGESHKAYPFIELNKHDKSRFTDSLNGKIFIVHWNKEEQVGSITDDKGIPIPVIQGYWFAWYAFHPDTLVFTMNKTKE
jgi:hypothetical protein